ncbi:MAG TPA: lamin tail domain-containing protein [Candidatus Polarisedimenticolia bacterium]|nr:lamin tail domain-containing protein [Candidatus Polarisedimenticolia bacterium]
MLRGWGGLIWAFVGAIAAAVALQALILREASGATGEGLCLSEILAGPARDWDGDGVYDSKADEWVEVRNRGTSPVTLDEYRLADALGTVRIALVGTLAPGDVMLVTGSAAVEWQRQQGLATAGLSLNNAGDTVFLFHIAGTDTVTADQHTYGAIEAGSDRSVGRAGSQSEDWVLYDGLNRYTGSGPPVGTGCSPTPGGPNGCATDVQGTTWGKIKRLYR